MVTDKTIMTFGTHKGKEIQNIPPTWLFWFHNTVEDKIKKGQGISQIEQDIHEYVVENKQVLHKELRESQQK